MNSTLKKYQGKKSLGSVLHDALEQGWEVDREEYDRGSDGIWLRDLMRREIQVYFNTINGNFFVYTPASEAPKATHLSKEYDDEDWYNELLNLFYVPCEPAPSEGDTV